MYGLGIRWILGEQVVKITPAVQYPHNLDNVISRPMKNYVGARSNRSEPRSYFIASTPGKGVIFYQPQCVNDFTDDFVRPLPAGATGVVVPDFGEISTRLRRPDYRPPMLRHPARAVGRGTARCREAYPHPPPGIGCPCRSPRGAGAAFARGTAAADLSSLARRPGASLFRRSPVRVPSPWDHHNRSSLRTEKGTPTAPRCARRGT